MTAAVSWKEKLRGAIREDWAREIDIFETQIELRKKGKVEEKLFAETRLRRGVYGQRYDNGQRHDGEKTQLLEFPQSPLTKGPNTALDAPGMTRIKIPFGKMNAEQLEVLADCAEEYSDHILHVTTRQDIQLHFVHIEDTPDMMRRLAAVGITTREACGNSVRNVTACPIAGVCNTESFDVAPYAKAITFFLLGHPDAQDFGRKLKIAFSGCKDQPCGLTNFHDIGCIAKTRTENGVTKRGFEFYVGGGLGSVPYPAALFDEFLPEEELLPMSQAVCRVFGRLGEKENRSRARIKFLVKKLGIDEFRRLVLEERKTLRPDPRWTEFLSKLHEDDEEAAEAGAPLAAGKPSGGLRGMVRLERAEAAPAGLRHRHRDAAARRLHAAAGARRRRHGAPLLGRRAPHDRRAEPPVSLGPRSRSAGALRGALAPSGSASRAPTRSPTSPRAPAPTPASSASRARAGSPASSASA